MQSQAFFHKTFGGGGGTCFWGQYLVPIGDRDRWGEGLALGMESDEGDLEKLSAEAKNASLQQN